MKHIDQKAKADAIARANAQAIQKAESVLKRLTLNHLLLNSDAEPKQWHIKQNADFKAFKHQVNKTIKEITKEAKTSLKKGSKELELTKKQEKVLLANVSNTLNSIQMQTLNQSKSIAASIYSQARSRSVNTATFVIDMLQKRAANQDFLNYVIYKDGKAYNTDSYVEMRARTEIHKDLTENMINVGAALGIIFYVCSYFGDCAKDHADYQGLIYVDRSWRSICPKDRIEEVEEYISQHNIMTYQNVTETDPYLTTRPNCRHTFQPLSIEDVLGIKTKQDLEDKRQQMGMNAGGEYNVKKSRSLESQRYNERNIRHWKEETQKNEILLEDALKRGDKESIVKYKNLIVKDENKVREWQARQRELVNKHSNLERTYAREQIKR